MSKTIIRTIPITILENGTDRLICEKCGAKMESQSGVKDRKKTQYAAHPFKCPKCGFIQRVKVKTYYEPNMYSIKDHHNSLYLVFSKVYDKLRLLFDERQEELKNAHKKQMPFTLDQYLYSQMHCPNYYVRTEIDDLINTAIFDALTDDQTYSALRVLFFTVIGQQDPEISKEISEPIFPLGKIYKASTNNKIELMEFKDNGQKKSRKRKLDA